MHYAFHDFIGNIGLVLLLGTYLLLQLGKIDSTRLLYSLLNALASLLIGTSLLFAFNCPPFWWRHSGSSSASTASLAVCRVAGRHGNKKSPWRKKSLDMLVVRT